MYPLKSNPQCENYTVLLRQFITILEHYKTFLIFCFTLHIAVFETIFTKIIFLASLYNMFRSFRKPPPLSRAKAHIVGLLLFPPPPPPPPCLFSFPLSASIRYIPTTTTITKTEAIPYDLMPEEEEERGKAHHMRVSDSAGTFKPTRLKCISLFMFPGGNFPNS